GQAPQLSGIQQKSAAVTTGTIAATAGTFVIEGKGTAADQTVNITLTMSDADAKAEITAKLELAGYTDQTVEVQSGAFTITSKSLGADAELVDITAGTGTTGAITETAGKNGVTNFVETDGDPGVFTKDVEAASHKFSVTY